LSEYLAGDASPDEVIRYHDESGLYFIPAGNIPEKTGELLRSGRTQLLMEELSRRYDYILIDCSPAGLVADAYYLSRLVDMVLYIIRNKKTNKDFLRYTFKEFHDDGIRNIAAIFNDIDTKNGYYGNHYYYGKAAYYFKHKGYYS